MSWHFQILTVSLVGLILLKGCDKAPKYVKPTLQTSAGAGDVMPVNFKETDAWKLARPKDDVIREKWWEMFGDPKLNELEERVNISNQNIALADANFRAARALVKEARSQYFPLVTTAPNMTISQQSAALGRSAFSSQGVFKLYSVPFSASWEPYFWHHVTTTVS